MSETKLFYTGDNIEVTIKEGKGVGYSRGSEFGLLVRNIDSAIKAELKKGKLTETCEFCGNKLVTNRWSQFTGKKCSSPKCKGFTPFRHIKLRIAEKEAS